MKASVTSDRAARVTTSMPAQAIRKANDATAPHCPGDTHTCSVNSSMATMAPFAGLKTCLPRIRIANLLAIAMTAARHASAASFVRSSRHKDNPEMKALREVERNGADGAPSRSQTVCVPSALARINAARRGVMSKSSHPIP
jgi:hypothetical protein